MTSVYTGGTFDLLHPGHIELLDACRHLAGPLGKVVVGLNEDGFVQKYKGRAPVQTYAERERMLASLRTVNAVIPHKHEFNSLPTLEAAFAWRDLYFCGPKSRGDDDWTVAIGDDWAGRDYKTQMGFPGYAFTLMGHPIQVVYIPRTTRFSTTMLRQTNDHCSCNGIVCGCHG